MKKFILILYLIACNFLSIAQCDLNTTIIDPISCTGPLYAEVEFEVTNSTLPVIITFDNVTLNYLGVPVNIFVNQGTYIVTSQDAGGCIDVDTLIIGAVIDAQVQIFGAACSICTNGVAVVNPMNGDAPFVYSWVPNIDDSTNYAYNLTPGNYNCTVTDSNGCIGSFTANVGFNNSGINLSGNVFFDRNNNGVNDFNDYTLTNQRISLITSFDTVFTFTDDSGFYTFFTDSGSYILQLDVDNGFILTSAFTSYIVNVQPFQQLTGFDFGLGSDTILNYDGAIALSGYFPRCNSLNKYFVKATNKSNLSLFGKIKLELPSAVTYSSSNLLPTIIAPDSIIWDNVEFLINKEIEIECEILLPNSQGVLLNYEAFIQLFDSMGNIVFLDSTTLDNITRCSYDPNNKLVSPVDINNTSTTGTNQFITYTINFQNTGTDTAFNVLLVDTINALLDLNSLEILGASHSYFIEVSDNILSIRFDNILLPDSNINEPKSHGSFSFRLKAFDSISIPNIIDNIAYIYFDANPPIQTNTAITLIHDATFVIENSEQLKQIYVYPNPTTDNLCIYTEKEIMAVDIFTSDGRLIKTFSNINDQMVCIDLKDFQKGNYLAKINFKDKILFKKIIKL